MSASSRPIAARDVDSWDDEADVVVVGFGMAGVSAALEAAEQSPEIDVLVLERSSDSEGYCGGIVYLGGGTPMQKEMGFEDSPDQMFTHLRACLGGGLDEDKLKTYCDESVSHYEWLAAHGVRFFPGADPEGSELATAKDDDGIVHVGAQEYAGGGLVWTGGEDAYPFDELTQPIPRGHIPRDPDAETDIFEGGPFRPLIATAKETENIRRRVDTGVERLIVDDAGRVVGAEAKSYGSTLRVRARGGVVIATGGFIFNDEMLERHNPALVTTPKVGHGSQDGSGIEMAAAAGADTIHMDTADVTLMMFPPISFKTGILVNERGQRFVNEDAYFGELGARSKWDQDGNCFLILDEEIWIESSWRRPRWVGDSVEELESEMGLPAGSLRATIDLYNSYAEKDEDPLFHKRSRWLKPLIPGFAVIDLRDRPEDTASGPHKEESAVAGADWVLGALTLGGLRTNADSEVLDPSGSVIDGLFAAGRATSGLATDGYCSGISLGDGSFFGRRAGRSAVRSGAVVKAG